MIGSVGVRSVVTDSAMSAISMESGRVADTFSTPWMLALMEGASVEAVEPRLASHETTVGVEAHIYHVAATAIGAEVRAEARIVAAQDGRITFTVTAWDHDRRIGHGRHVRRVVDRQRFQSALQARKKTVEP